MILRDEINARIAAITAKAASDVSAINTRANSDIVKLQNYLAVGGFLLDLDTDVFNSEVGTLMSILRAK